MFGKNKIVAEICFYMDDEAKIKQLNAILLMASFSYEHTKAFPKKYFMSMVENLKSWRHNKKILKALKW